MMKNEIKKSMRKGGGGGGGRGGGGRGRGETWHWTYLTFQTASYSI